ncbi:MAG: hypothetical protein ABIO83_10740 [Ilumatobacteraceae bacterium]
MTARDIHLERHTRRLVRRWTAVSMSCVLAATLLAVGAGGNSAWTRWALGVASMAGFVAATRYRASLHIGVLAGVAMLAVLPFDARVDRSLVAGIGAIMIVLAAETAQIARRHVTTVPLRFERRDATALVRLGAASVVGLAVCAAAARLERFPSRLWIAGVFAVVVAVGAADPFTRRRGSPGAGR